MAEARIWKRFLWRWRYWVFIVAMAAPILIHIIFPSLFPDWIIDGMEMMIEAFF
jgi:hypothetical protein